MTSKELKGRLLKQYVLEILQQEHLQAVFEKILQIPARRVVNPLFSLLHHHDPDIRWRAVSAMGRVVSHQAETDITAARITMRRLMWNLNDESGGIGWGSPEAMGDILARSDPMAREYEHILVSYIDPRGNYLEHDILQQGVLWGLGRLFHEAPERHVENVRLLLPFFKAPDAVRRGLAVWAVGPLAAKDARESLVSLIDDTALLKIYMDGKIIDHAIRDLVSQALNYF